MPPNFPFLVQSGTLKGKSIGNEFGSINQGSIESRANTSFPPVQSDTLKENSIGNGIGSLNPQFGSMNPQLGSINQGSIESRAIMDKKECNTHCLKKYECDYPDQGCVCYDDVQIANIEGCTLNDCDDDSSDYIYQQVANLCEEEKKKSKKVKKMKKSRKNKKQKKEE